MADVRMPDGTIIRNVPAGAKRADIERAWQKARQAKAIPDQRPASHTQGFYEGVTNAASNALNYLERAPMLQIPSQVAAATMNAVRGTTAPMQKSLSGGWQPSVSGTLRRERDDLLSKSGSRGSKAGRIIGEIAATLPTAVGPGGAFLQGALAGGLVTEDPNNTTGVIRDTTLGGVAGKAGEQVGKRVIAPIAERVGRTAPVRKLGEAAARAVKRAPLPLPSIAQAERNVLRATREGKPLRKVPNLEPVRQNISEAADLGLPYSLADASPQLRSLGGSVARYSPEGQALAMRNFDQRALGQADRAVNAIDRRLAPVTNIAQRGDEIMAAGAGEYRPLYDRAYANPPITSPRLQEILATPAGRQATSRANTIAANEFRNPRELGFVLDADGNVVIDPRITLDADEAGNLIAAQSPLREPGYSTQSLDYVKRGMDDILEQYRDPVSNRLQLDEAGRAINGVKNSLLTEMDRVNPEYAAARAAYQRFASRKSALNTGHDVLPKGSVPQRSFDAIMSRATPETLPELQRGYATSMADTANSQRLSGNPYNAIAGSTDQQAKISRLFPEGAPQFLRQRELENEMALTRQKVLGGSDTQARNVADQIFQNDAANAAIDGGIQLATGGGIPGATKTAGFFARRFLGSPDIGMLGAQKKADELAPVLFDTSNPSGLLDYISQLSRKLEEEQLRKQAYGRVGGLLGIPLAPGVVSSGR